MDLNTIRKNIDLGIIRATREFQRDMMLMFTNALMYNHSSHDVHKMARVMYQDSMAQIEVSLSLSNKDFKDMHASLSIFIWKNVLIQSNSSIRKSWWGVSQNSSGPQEGQILESATR